MNEEQTNAVRELRESWKWGRGEPDMTSVRWQRIDRAIESVITLLDQAQRERDEFKVQRAAAIERVQELEHCDQMWEETLAKFSDYEGDEAPWLIMEREFNALKAKCARLETAAQLALDWATGQGQFSNGKDTIPELADVVAPALEMALAKS